MVLSLPLLGSLPATVKSLAWFFDEDLILSKFHLVRDPMAVTCPRFVRPLAILALPVLPDLVTPLGIQAARMSGDLDRQECGTQDEESDAQPTLHHFPLLAFENRIARSWASARSFPNFLRVVARTLGGFAFISLPADSRLASLGIGP